MSILNRPGWANRTLVTEAKKAYGGLNAHIFNLLDKSSVGNVVYVKNIILNNLLNDQSFKDFLSSKGVDMSNPEFHKSPDVVSLTETPEGKAFIQNAFQSVSKKGRYTPKMIGDVDSDPTSTVADEPQSASESEPVESEVSSTPEEPTAPPTSDSKEEFGGEDEEEEDDDDGTPFEVQPEEEAPQESEPEDTNEDDDFETVLRKARERSLHNISNGGGGTFAKKLHGENKKPSPQEVNRLLQENYIKSKQHKFNVEERYRF